MSAEIHQAADKLNETVRVVLGAQADTVGVNGDFHESTILTLRGEIDSLLPIAPDDLANPEGTHLSVGLYHVSAAEDLGEMTETTVIRFIARRPLQSLVELRTYTVLPDVVVGSDGYKSFPVSSKEAHYICGLLEIAEWDKDLSAEQANDEEMDELRLLL